MDNIFSLVREADRSSLLRSMFQSFGCTYICLWSYFSQPYRCLYFLDGHYNEDNNQPRQSSGSLAKRLFDGYQREVFYVLNNHIPGIAFIDNQPYRQLNQPELLRRSSAAVQRQFYQEARIKTAVFMGCRSGEIELGWSNEINQINMENAMTGWFSEHNTPQQSQITEFCQSFDPSRPSSSSSSLRSLDSHESCSFMFNTPTASHPLEIPTIIQQDLQFSHPTPTTSTGVQQALCLQSSASNISPHQHAMRAFALSRNINLPTPESEDAAITKAIIAVLTSSTSSSSSSSNLPDCQTLSQQRVSAFKSYTTPQTTARLSTRRPTMLNRAFTYYTRLNLVRRQQIMANRPTDTQRYHMISERRRREKINACFEALRKLLPPQSKKDKATVLARTRDHLSLLKTQVGELTLRNQQLQAQLLPAETRQPEASNERVEVTITNVASESTSEDEERIVSLQVILRGKRDAADLVIRVFELLKGINGVNLISAQVNATSGQDSTFLSRLTMRFRIEGNEWDEAAFVEAVRRVVADVAQ